MRISLLLSCTILLTLFSCHEKKEGPASPPVGVTEYVVEPKTIPAVFEFVGFAQSSHPVEIRARVEGYLDKIAYQEGQLVHVGDLLFQLDPKQYEAKVAQAKGEVARQEALLENAKLTVARLTPLYEQKAASKKDLDNATASQLANQASLLSAQANLLDAEINLGYTTITSPITGYAEKAKLREGALINPGANSLMTTVSVLDPIWVYFTVSDNDLLRARQQEIEKKLILPENERGVTISRDNTYRVEAVLSDGSTYPYAGKVDYSSPTYDQSTGTMQVRGVFSNPQGELRPGQFMRVKVYGAERPKTLIVPQRALMQKQGGMYVYLISKDNKVIVQDVEIGEWYKDYQIIMGGLKPGDRVIVDGITKVRPGDSVKVLGTWSSGSATPNTKGKGT